MSGYPTDRHGVWCLDFIKLLHRAQAARDIGSSGVCLVEEVALTEHSKDYLSPPQFWNKDLKDACDISDDHAFAALRRRCVSAGWLVHKRGPYASAAGLYWVTIPPGLSRAMGRNVFVAKPHTRPQTRPQTDPPTRPQTDPPTDPQADPPTRPPTDPQSFSPSPNPSLPTPTHPHTGQGGGVGGGEDWQSLKDRRAQIEAVLDGLQVATGPKATARWIAAAKACKRVRTMGDMRACLVEVVGAARAAGETVNFASDVADRIRRWKPTEAQS